MITNKICYLDQVFVKKNNQLFRCRPNSPVRATKQGCEVLAEEEKRRTPLLLIKIQPSLSCDVQQQFASGFIYPGRLLAARAYEHDIIYVVLLLTALHSS